MFSCCGPEEKTAAETVEPCPAVQPRSAPQKEERQEKQDLKHELPDTGAATKQKVTLKRTSAKDLWGLSVEQVAASDTMLISLVAEGAAEEFNKASSAGAYQLKKYDCIVSIDGRTSIVDMTKIMSGTATQMELSVVRPSTITETLKVEAGQALGISLKHTEIGNTLTVVGINETGAAKKSGANILERDLVAAVDGEMGQGRELLEYIRSRMGEVTLTLLRIGE